MKSEVIHMQGFLAGSLGKGCGEIDTVYIKVQNILIYYFKKTHLEKMYNIST